MITKRENYLMAARGEVPHWIPCFTEDVNAFAVPFWKQVDPVTGTDFLNVKYVTNEFGRMPDERWRAMESIFDWRETAKFPDLASMDWEAMAAQFHASADPEKVTIATVNTHGIFLIPIYMLGWVEGLTSICLEAEETEAFVSRLTDFIVELVGYIGKYIKPDIMCSGDDVAASTGPFISKTTWTEMYKPYFRKIIDAIHAQGALAEFHCCGNCGYLVEEFLDVGADILQLPAVDEDLIRDKARFGKRLVMTGGWDRMSEAAKPGAPEEVVRASLHTAVDRFGKEGGLIFWDGGIPGQSADSQQKRFWLYDELHRYNAKLQAERA